jgi:hypothetical protein
MGYGIFQIVCNLFSFAIKEIIAEKRIYLKPVHLSELLIQKNADWIRLGYRLGTEFV